MERFDERVEIFVVDGFFAAQIVLHSDPVQGRVMNATNLLIR